MSQEEVLDILKKNKTQWFSAVDLKEIMGTSKGAVSVNARKLYQSGEINLKIEKKGSTYIHLFKYKRLNKGS